MNKTSHLSNTKRVLSALLSIVVAAFMLAAMYRQTTELLAWLLFPLLFVFFFTERFKKQTKKVAIVFVALTAIPFDIRYYPMLSEEWFGVYSVGHGHIRRDVVYNSINDGCMVPLYPSFAALVLNQSYLSFTQQPINTTSIEAKRYDLIVKKLNANERVTINLPYSDLEYEVKKYDGISRVPFNREANTKDFMYVVNIYGAWVALERWVVDES